eukprot:COSAG03_NODE_16086_length_412_cov_0.798722_1_plen_26_part_01
MVLPEVFGGVLMGVASSSLGLTARGM